MGAGRKQTKRSHRTRKPQGRRKAAEASREPSTRESAGDLAAEDDAGAVPSIRSDTDSGFAPSAVQVKYLQALEDAIAQRLPHSDTAICAKIGISRMTLWQWRQRPEFRAWLRNRMDQTSDDNWPLILRRHELLAIQGSVRSAEFIAKVRHGGYGEGRHADQSGIDPATQYTVNLLIPRPGPDGAVPPEAVASSKMLPLDHPDVQAAREAQWRQ